MLNLDHRDTQEIFQWHLNSKWFDNEKMMLDEHAIESGKMFKKIGCEGISSTVSYELKPLSSAIHELGTALIGKDPKESVLNGFNQPHDIPNLFVTDGASYCSLAAINPMIHLYGFNSTSGRLMHKRNKTGADLGVLLILGFCSSMV